MATETTPIDPGLTQLLTMYRQLSAVSSAVFAPLARTYVGRLAEHSKVETNADVVNLALRKLAFEAGEMAVASQTPPAADSKPAEFNLDEGGVPPDLKLSYVAAAALAYMKSRDAAKSQAAAPAVEVMGNVNSVRALRGSVRAATYAPAQAAAIQVRTTGGCGCGGKSSTTTSSGCGCGGGCGSTATPPPVAQPCYDPCAGGLVRVPPANEACGCGCGTTTKDCPSFWQISCDTQQKLKHCVSVLICDLFGIVETALTTPDPATGQTSALAPLFVNFLRCVREALCPTTTTQPCAGTAMPCLPCSYAVEMP
jgi:hypothetical protein